MTVTRDPIPRAPDGLELYCNDSPARPGYAPQIGDLDYKLTFPLHDGVQLILHCGKETHTSFVDMLAALAADDADEQIEGKG